MKKGKFKKTESGFQLEFKNGYLLSVQYSEYNYCDNYIGFNPKGNKTRNKNESTTAEIALMSKKRFVKINGQDVHGYVEFDTVMKAAICIWRHDPKTYTEEDLVAILEQVIYEQE